MSKSLDEIKENISQKYLGKSGIHGIGIRRKDNALYIYGEKDSIKKDVLEEIEKDAAPYTVVTIEEEKPKIN